MTNKTGDVLYTVPLSCFRTTVTPWKNNKDYIFWVCVCSLRYPACNAHAPYCHLWPVWLYTIFPHLMKARFSWGSRLNIKCVFDFCSAIISYSKKNWARYDRKRIFVAILDIFYKNTKIPNLMKIRPVGAEFFYADGRTDGRTSLRFFAGSSYYLRTNISVLCCISKFFLFTRPMKMEQSVPKRRHI